MMGSDKFERTGLAIKNACYALLGECPRDFITVSLICSRTGINRSTFYAHYKSLEGLFAEIDLQMIPELKSAGKSGRLSAAVLVKMLGYIKENGEYFTKYYDAGNQVDFRPMLRSIYHTGRNKEYKVTGINGALNSMIALWCSGGMERDPSEIAEMLKEILILS